MTVSPNDAHEIDNQHLLGEPSETEVDTFDLGNQLPQCDDLGDQQAPADTVVDNPSSYDEELVVGTDSPPHECQVGRSEGEPSIADDEADFLNVDEAMCRYALLLRLKGQTLQEIADYFGRSPRTIRRWITSAKKKGLVRVDKLKPWNELSTILTLIDQYRGELIQLKQEAQQRNDGPLIIRCLRELVTLEQKRLDILRKVGLYEGYTPRKTSDILSGYFDEAIRTRVDDEDEEDDGECNVKRG